MIPLSDFFKVESALFFLFLFQPSNAEQVLYSAPSQGLWLQVGAEPGGLGDPGARVEARVPPTDETRSRAGLLLLLV